MRVSVMQPYYVPYVTYFELIHVSDRFVIFDDVQYLRRGWINRNRIRSPRNPAGWTYLSIPTSVPCSTSPITEARTAEPGSWPSRHLALIREAFGPSAVDSPICRAIAAEPRTPGQPLVDLLHRILLASCQALGIDTPILRSSALSLPDELRGQDRVLGICDRLGATHYVNLPGGRALYDQEAFARRGVGLQFLPDVSYRGKDGAINPYSIVDLCLSDGPDAVRAYLDRRRDALISRSAA